MFRLTNKTAVVSGAASGIGAAIARALADAGAFVYVADLDAAGGAAVVAAISEAGGLAEFLNLDVSDEGSCRAAARHVLEANGGRCDILVNNAGIGHVGTALTTTGEDLDRLYAVNVKGVLFLSQAFLPAMIARQSGSIINLASIAGIVGIRDRLA
ncbi:MAG: SDR family NAD(P)-dependent oxidoreductase, partial [Armatimonadota bacterium]|nr:SDR family NAD(P)-dependent oxidoreductase [Armatimonadota bacterium]